MYHEFTHRKIKPPTSAMVANLDRFGGSTVEYQHLFAFPLYNRMTRVYEWVPPGRNRCVAGIKHALFCLLFGWLSLGGLFTNPALIICNLLGGVDATALLPGSKDGAPAGPSSPAAIAGYNRQRKIQSYVYVGWLFFLLLLVIVFCVIPNIHEFEFHR